MEERAPQNGCFFIHFVMFPSTLVYSAIWNQSLGEISNEHRCLITSSSLDATKVKMASLLQKNFKSLDPHLIIRESY